MIVEFTERSALNADAIREGMSRVARMLKEAQDNERFRFETEAGWQSRVLEAWRIYTAGTHDLRIIDPLHLRYSSPDQTSHNETQVNFRLDVQKTAVLISGRETAFKDPVGAVHIDPFTALCCAVAEYDRLFPGANMGYRIRRAKTVMSRPMWTDRDGNPPRLDRNPFGMVMSNALPR